MSVHGTTNGWLNKIVTNKEKQSIQQKNLIWSIAVESTLQSKEDPILVYERLLRKYENKKTVTA